MMIMCEILSRSSQDDSSFEVLYEGWMSVTLLGITSVRYEYVVSSHYHRLMRVLVWYGTVTLNIRRTIHDDSHWMVNWLQRCLLLLVSFRKIDFTLTRWLNECAHLISSSRQKKGEDKVFCWCAQRMVLFGKCLSNRTQWKVAKQIALLDRWPTTQDARLGCQWRRRCHHSIYSHFIRVR